MKKVVQRLLDGEESAYSISKETGVYSSVIQRLRLGEQTIESCKFDNIERLYQYQLNKEMTIPLNLDRYSDYRKNVKAIKNSDDLEFKYRTLMRNNGNIVMSLKSVFSAIGIEKNSKAIEDRLLYKIADLLILDEGHEIQAIDEHKDIFYYTTESRTSTQDKSIYVSAIEIDDINESNSLIDAMSKGAMNNCDTQISSVKVDTFNDVRFYLLIESESFENVLMIKNEIGKEGVKSAKDLQDIIDRT